MRGGDAFNGIIALGAGIAVRSALSPRKQNRGLESPSKGHSDASFGPIGERTEKILKTGVWQTG